VVKIQLTQKPLKLGHSGFFVVATFIALLGVAWVEKINSFLMAGLLLCFGVILFEATESVDTARFAHKDWMFLSATVPLSAVLHSKVVICFALVFSMLVLVSSYVLQSTAVIGFLPYVCCWSASSSWGWNLCRNSACQR
jgi:hypothetical protein